MLWRVGKFLCRTKRNRCRILLGLQNAMLLHKIPSTHRNTPILHERFLLKEIVFLRFHTLNINFFNCKIK